MEGPAGVGKTRLAIEVAGRVAGDFRDGVMFTDHPDLRRLLEQRRRNARPVGRWSVELVGGIRATSRIKDLANIEGVRAEPEQVRSEALQFASPATKRATRRSTPA